MTNPSRPLLVLLLAATLQAADEPKLSPLPIPVSNNAVVITHAGKESRIFSFMGLGPKKTWDAITNKTFALDLPTGKWTEVRPVPGVAGRLAASAASVRDQIVLIGGFFGDAPGGRNTRSHRHIFFPYQDPLYCPHEAPRPLPHFLIRLHLHPSPY